MSCSTFLSFLQGLSIAHYTLEKLINLVLISVIKQVAFELSLAYPVSEVVCNLLADLGKICFELFPLWVLTDHL